MENHDKSPKQKGGSGSGGATPSSEETTEDI